MPAAEAELGVEPTVAGAGPTVPGDGGKIAAELAGCEFAAELNAESCRTGALVGELELVCISNLSISSSSPIWKVFANKTRAQFMLA
jgi:hypothetical protein